MYNNVFLMDNTSTSDEILYDLNRKEVIERLPVILYIAILAVAGVIGNAHVLFTYKTKFKPSTYRVFIICLSIIDMVCCCVSMPFEIVDEMFPYLYKDIVSCKIFRFINTCVAVASALMLVVIAFERYRKICKPHGDQMSDTTALYSSIGVIIVSVVFTFPAIYVYGRKTLILVETNTTTVEGFECTWGDHMDETLYGYFYFAWLLLIIIACMVCLVVFYSIIGMRLRAHNRAISASLGRTTKLHAQPTSAHANKDTGNNMHVPVATNMIKSDSKCRLNESKESLISNKLSTNVQVSGQTDRQCANYRAQSKLTSRNPSDKEKRITKVLFTIALLFIMSFLPYIVILITYTAMPSYEVNMTSSQKVLYLIGLRLYMVNSVANSILYGFFDLKFRKHVLQMYATCFSRTSNLIVRRKDHS